MYQVLHWVYRENFDFMVPYLNWKKDHVPIDIKKWKKYVHNRNKLSFPKLFVAKFSGK